MSWMKCFFGCVFEVEDKEWANKMKLPHIICPICHRSNEKTKYKSATNGHVTQMVSSVMGISSMLVTSVEQKVKERICDEILPHGFFKSNHKKKADAIYNRLVMLMLNAELNSNFPAKNIVGLLSSGVMKNMWAFPVADTDSARKYAAERDAGERQVFGTFHKPISENVKPTAIDRPVYVTLNIGNLIQGGASMYGFSYFVYKDAVKLRSTFLATDSLQMIRGEERKKEENKNLAYSKQHEVVGVGSQDLAIYATLPNVLLRVDTNRLKFLCYQAGGPAANYNDAFIEAHGWGEINLEQDVKAIVISNFEWNNFLLEHERDQDGVPDSFKGKNLIERQKILTDLKEQLESFCLANAIKLHFLDLDVSTTRSTVSRPNA